MVTAARGQQERQAGATRAGGPRPKTGGPSPSHQLLMLQRAAGNRAVASLLAVQRGCACGCGGACEEQDETAAPPVQRQSLDDILNQFMDTPPVWNPSTGCQPFSTDVEARMTHRAMREVLLTAINVKFSNAEVTRLWRLYINGGSGLQVFTDPGNSIVQAFARSATTAQWNQWLADVVAQRLEASPPAFAPGVDEVVLPVKSLVDAATLATLDTPPGMDFNQPTELPGNIAGGIGKDQLSTPVGARPSPFNDSRQAEGSVTVRRNPDGTLTMTTGFMFDIVDTIDICPGNLGAGLEQNLTIPLSRLEAHGLAGDVPFQVKFPGSALARVITPRPSPSPATFQGRVTASPSLRIRSGPGLANGVVGRYPRGEVIEVLEQVEGDPVNGNRMWNRTARGFVSDAYVQRLVPAHSASP
jgi:hypothetical protein